MPWTASSDEGGIEREEADEIDMLRERERV